MRAAAVRVYFDADILGMAKLLAGIRSDFTYPGDPGGAVHKRSRPACPITDPAVPDTEWIPATAANRWLAITRDAHIHDSFAELESIRSSGARIVNLASKDAGTLWNQLEVFMSCWHQIEALLDEAGPFVWVAHRASGLRKLDLDLLLDD